MIEGWPFIHSSSGQLPSIFSVCGGGGTAVRRVKRVSVISKGGHSLHSGFCCRPRNLSWVVHRTVPWLTEVPDRLSHICTVL